MRSFQTVVGQSVSSAASQDPKLEPVEPEEQKEENPRALRKSKRRRKK